MVHKTKHRVHSFRGLLADGGQDEINLERSNVNLAYRIFKFQVIESAPGTADVEIVSKIYREEQSSFVATVDFTDTDLLGVAYYQAGNSTEESAGTTIIFDSTLFSRNIYVSARDAGAGAGSINYYIELEEVPVGAATLMQLKLQVARKLNLQQD